jgi:DNA-binding protein HU-beta
MKKKDLITAICSRTARPRGEVTEVVNVLVDAVNESLSLGVKISIVGFGQFYVKEREPCVTRNPKTGNACKTPLRRYVRFKPSTSLKDSLNKE